MCLFIISPFLGMYENYLISGIVGKVFNRQFYAIKMQIMMVRAIKAEFKWIVLAMVLTVLVAEVLFESFENQGSRKMFDVSFFEIIVFFVLSTFVVFGIKGFFERFSQKFANVVILTSGVILTVVIFILSYQILIQP